MLVRKKTWVLINLILLAALLCYLLYWRFQVSQLRFFDVDEFSYLHWAAQIARGERIYTDFFMFVTPGFVWLQAPLFWLFGVTTKILLLARAETFTVFLAILGTLGAVWGVTRGWKMAILPPIILAFLPLPYDKFLELRPDNLATLLVLVGILCEIVALNKKNKKSSILWLLSGLFYSASLFVLVKTLPIIVLAVAIGLFGEFLPLLTGLVAPWILYFGVTAFTGQFHAVWYSLTQLPFEVYKISANIIMVPTLFFYPNVAFYGASTMFYGLTDGLLINHALWILAILMGVYRLCTPFNNKRPLIQLLIAGSFVVSIIAYVKYYPLKHSQYLVPVAVFVAYYAADGLSLFFEWLKRVGGYASLTIVLLGFAYLLGVVTIDVNQPKLANTNTAQTLELSNLIKTVPLSARVVDLEGKMMFWRDGYPICCVPFDSFLPYVTEKPAPLAQYLSRYPADYIYDGDSGRLATLAPENLTYIKEHFTPVPGFAQRLWKRQ